MDDVIKIRKARSDDLDDCAKILDTKYTRSADGEKINKNFLKGFMIPKCRFYVATINDEVVGCAIGENSLENGLIAWYVGVAKKYRDKGVAQMLMAKLEHNKKWIYAICGISNKASNALCKKRGYIRSKLKYYEYLKFNIRN